MAGYSKTPLINKLGIKESNAIFVQNAPVDYWKNLGQLPINCTLYPDLKTVELDFIHVFFKDLNELETNILNLKAALKKDRMLWV